MEAALAYAMSMARSVIAEYAKEQGRVVCRTG
jgi:hypothetical protein